MQKYASKTAFLEEIGKLAAQFTAEFDDVSDKDMDLRLDGVDKTPREMLAYQLGWIELLRGWDRAEKSGEEVITPAPGYKWNKLGPLYEMFYKKYSTKSLEELKQLFNTSVSDLIVWLQAFSEEELFVPGGRKWASSTPSNWPVWKWVHINTASPFKTFKSKIRKWKKLRSAV